MCSREPTWFYKAIHHEMGGLRKMFQSFLVGKKLIDSHLIQACLIAETVWRTKCLGYKQRTSLITKAVIQTSALPNLSSCFSVELQWCIYLYSVESLTFSISSQPCICRGDLQEVKVFYITHCPDPALQRLKSILTDCEKKIQTNRENLHGNSATFLPTSMAV